MSAGVGLYMFACDDEFGAEVYSGATTEKQAWEVFRPARLMAQRTEPLREAFGIEVHAQSMSRPEDGARFEPLIEIPETARRRVALSLMNITSIRPMHFTRRCKPGWGHVVSR